jgi:hypothetical protein
MLLRYTSRQHRIRTPSGRNVNSSEDVTIRKGRQPQPQSPAPGGATTPSCRRRALLDACVLTVSWRSPRRSRSPRRGEEQILDQPMPPRCRLGAFSELTQLLGVANSPCADFGESIRKLPRASAHPRQPVRGEPRARRGSQTEGLIMFVGRNSRGKRDSGVPILLHAFSTGLSGFLL